ncbi:hairy and enhancer of split related-7 [Polymixia lowei]
MKLSQEAEDAKLNRKLLKPQVERRRRERMNRSLENLRSLLLQGPQQQGKMQPRVEKAEILEHTVLFLQSTTEGDRTRAGGEGLQHPFQDGFSACLQRATQFLGPQEEGLRLGAALDATFAARFAGLDSTGLKVTIKTRSPNTLRHTESSQSIPQVTMVQKSKHRHARAHALNLSMFAPSNRVPTESAQQPQRSNRVEIRVQRQSTTETQSRSVPPSQTLWRPWP